MRKQRGAASLFIVIFTALMVTVVTVGFTQIMIRNHEQAQAADLSQSAYDAALAGVEDAKRLLVHYVRDCELSPTSPAADCANVAATMDAKNCDTSIKAGLATAKSGTESEVQVGDPALNQSYTCLKISRFSTEYPTILTPNSSSALIPLQPQKEAVKARVWWYSLKDNGDQTTVSTNIFQPAYSPLPLVKTSEWPDKTPPILRAQYLPSVDNEALVDKGNTVFGYPRTAGGSPVAQSRRDSNFHMDSAKCASSFDSTTTLGLCYIDVPLNPIIPAGGSGYLQLSGVYIAGQVSLNVQLLDAAGGVVALGGIPTVDSTGRAAERFRRVLAHVKVGAGAVSNRPQPRAALDTKGNLCKTFFVTNDANDYQSGSCTP